MYSIPSGFKIPYSSRKSQHLFYKIHKSAASSPAFFYRFGNLPACAPKPTALCGFLPYRFGNGSLLFLLSVQKTFTADIRDRYILQNKCFPYPPF